MKSNPGIVTLQPLAHWTRITTIDMHTGGEPLRVYASGLPIIEGRTVLEKRRYFREHYDHLRTGTLFEPRGHADMYGAVLSRSTDADFDVFFLHNEGYSTMCGHAIIALVKLVVETGMVAGPQVTFNAPAGRIEAHATIKDGSVTVTAFRNVPSFVLLRDRRVSVPGLGEVRFDVAYGGAFYAIVEAPVLGLELTAEYYDRLIDAGRRIKAAGRPRASQPQCVRLCRRRSRPFGHRIRGERAGGATSCTWRAAARHAHHDREHPRQYADRAGGRAHGLRPPRCRRAGGQRVSSFHGSK